MKILSSGFEKGLSVRRWAGAESRGTMLWIHGLGESGRCFEHLPRAPRLARWQHAVPDLLGYGKSPWPESPLSLADHAQYLRAWIERSGLPGPLVLIGHSMGGVIGEILLRRSMPSVAGFVNVEGNISAGDCTTSKDVAALSLAELRDGGLARILDRLYRAGVDDPAQRGYYASLTMCDPATLHRNSGELVELSTGEGLATRLGALRLPQLYLLGHPGGAGERSRQLLDRAGVTWRAIEPAGHWPYIDRPQVFVDLLADFADGLGHHPETP